MQKEIAVGIVILGAISLCKPSVAAPDQATQDRCSHYAQRAVQQYQLMSSNPQCHVKTDLRWQDNVDNHYNGCLMVPEFFRKTEEAARDNHLKACGGWAEDTTASNTVASNAATASAAQPAAQPSQAQSASPPSETKTIAIGQSRDQVIAAFGVPTKIVQLAKKEIDYYPDMKVTFVEGKVADVN